MASLPKIRIHKGYWVCNPPGKRTSWSLGSVAKVSIEQARAELLSRLRTPPPQESTGLTVRTLVELFQRRADEDYTRPDGTPTGEADNIMYALNPLLDIYGGIDAQDFNPTHLDGYVEAQKADDVSRQTINKRIGIIKRMFKWAKNKRLTKSPHPYDECRDYEGAKAGKGFREAPKIPAVPQDIVDLTLPHLPLTVQTMIKLQIHGRMRPEEVCSLRPCDIDRTQVPWLYRPVWHKNLHRGQERRIFLGAVCQALLTPYLDGAADAPVFSPRAAVGERRGKLPRKRIGACYDTRSYRKAIWYACERAGLARWSPNRLRKLGLDLVEKAMGKQAAKAAAGHSRVETTQDYYLSGNDAAARAVAEAMG